MKTKQRLLLSVLLTKTKSYGQASSAISYQAVACEVGGMALINRALCIH